MHRDKASSPQAVATAANGGQPHGRAQTVLTPPSWGTWSPGHQWGCKDPLRHSWHPKSKAGTRGAEMQLECKQGWCKGL